MPSYLLDIEYDGTDWHGWQSQPDLPTIQQAIENALGIALRKRVAIVGSGRTDAGVHASGQIAHMVLENEIDSSRICRSLNGLLPDSIAIRQIKRVADSFHARFDAVLRTYRYQVNCSPIALGRAYHWHLMPTPDFVAMNDAASALLGKHNYSSFCRTSSETPNRVCRVHTAQWVTGKREGDWSFIIAADRFLHGMVRSIVGTLVEIGHGKRPAGELPSMLLAQDREAAGYAAPARGLILEKVEYPV